MSDELNVKISDIKAKFIKEAAENVDKYSRGSGARDGKINAEEAEVLRTLLNGDLQKSKNQKKLAKESDEVKAIFGLNVSTPIEISQTTSVEIDKVNQAIGEASKKTYKTPFEQVKARFLEVMEYDEEKNTSNGTTTKEAYKQVAKEFSDKDYKEAIKQLKDYAKHEFVNMRAQKTRAAVQAYDSEGNIVNVGNLQYDTSKKVYEREKELTMENNNGVKDKWAKRAIRNKNVSFIKRAARYLSGNDSAGKTDDKAVASGNKAAIIREYGSFSQADLEEALGKDNPLIQPYQDTKGNTYDNVLVATGLMVKNKDNEYSVKELSKVVGRAVGADNTLNDHDNHNEGEIQAVLTKLYQALRANGSGEFKTSELKDSQIRDLVELLGYGDDRAKLFAVRVWQNLWKGAGRGAVAGAAAGAASGSWYIDIKQHQEVSIPMEGFTDVQKTEFIKALKSENSLSGLAAKVDYGSGLTETSIGEIAENAVGIYIAQDQMVKGTVVSLLKSIAIGTLAGAGVGAAMGALESLGSHAREREVLGMVFDCDSTYEEIIDTIDNAYSEKHLSAQMKEALKKVAELGIVKEKDPKTGVMKAVLDENCNTKWDYCQFIEAYNEARGNQIFNEAEVRATARTAEKHKAVIPDCNEAEPVKVPEKENTSAPEILWAEEITSDDNMNVRGYSWDSLAKMYDCFPKDINKAKRMLKIMQGMSGSKLTVEQIAELADISKKQVSLHYKRQNGVVVRDRYGNPIFDVADAKRQLQQAFANYNFPEGYVFNYEQCANALCASVPGDNQNEIIAPTTLLYKDGTICNKQKVSKPNAGSSRSEAGDRGNAGKVGSKRNAVKDGDNPVQHNVSDKILNEAKQRGKEDKKIL